MHTQKSINNITEVLADIPSLLARISEQKAKGEAVLSLPEKYQRLAAIVEEIAEIYILTGQWDQAVHLLRSIIEMADKADDKGKSGARVRILLGNLLQKRGSLKEASRLIQEAKRLAEQAADDRTLGDAIYYLGELYYIEAFYMHKRDRDEALELYNEALALRKKAGDGRGVVHSLSRLGTIYEQTGKPDLALEYHNEAIRVANEIGYERGLDRPITHLGAFHHRRDEFEKALEHFWQVFEINLRTDDQESLVFTLGSIGDTLCRIDKNYIDVALQLCAHSLVLGEDLDFKLGICRTHLIVGELYLGCGERDKAKERFQKVSELAASVGYERFRLAAEESIAELAND
ncbi:MAG: tetratricopeptide repeat protein [Chloroflexota bacterium]|nr:tetratricopeptide repeat protein [Chloroflexota bacterium]